MRHAVKPRTAREEQFDGTGMLGGDRMRPGPIRTAGTRDIPFDGEHVLCRERHAIQYPAAGRLQLYILPDVGMPAIVHPTHPLCLYV